MIRANKSGFRAHLICWAIIPPSEARVVNYYSPLKKTQQDAVDSLWNKTKGRLKSRDVEVEGKKLKCETFAPIFRMPKMFQEYFVYHHNGKHVR